MGEATGWCVAHSRPVLHTVIAGIEVDLSFAALRYWVDGCLGHREHQNILGFSL